MSVTSFLHFFLSCADSPVKWPTGVSAAQPEGEGVVLLVCLPEYYGKAACLRSLCAN